MPTPGKQWRHVVFTTQGTWLPGDPRGFRTRDHKVHSSGDYKNPPPKGEHAELFKYSKEITPEKVLLPQDLWRIVGLAIRRELLKQESLVLAISVAADHVHLLAELSMERSEGRAAIGRCKTAACFAVKDQLPGRIWAGLGKYKLVDSPTYQKRVYQYILNQKHAWVWSFRMERVPGEDVEGLFNP